LKVQAIREERTFNLIDRQLVKDLGRDDKMKPYDKNKERDVYISSDRYKAFAKIELEWYEEPDSVDSKSTFYVCHGLPYDVYLARQRR